MPTATHHRAGEALPRPLITIGVPCAGVLLIAFFLIRGFPYDKLGELIAGSKFCGECGKRADENGQ